MAISKEYSFYYLSSLAILIAFFISCEKIYEPIEIQGIVIDVDTEEPVSNAQVSIVSPSEISALTFTNESGEYLFTEVDVDSIIDITIESTKMGYSTDRVTLLAAPEKMLTVPNLRIRNLEGPGDDDSPDSDGSASITLNSKSKDFIQVRGTGGDETVDLDFVVRDSSGTIVSNNNAVMVRFEIASGPNGGESIYPDSTLTRDGIARATLTSGTKAGAVQVRASFERNGVRSQSSPVSVTISGGLPSINHFEVSTESQNMPARSSTPNEITVLLGDKHGNPVIPGTAVYFSTNKGNIDGSRNTDDEGYAFSQLRTNNTTPGFATVKVETVDENSSTITRELDILFSGRPAISVSPQNIDLLGFTSQIFEVKLSDENGYPLSPGTTMEVTVDNSDLTLTGSTSIEITNDEVEAGNGVTDFEFRLRNPNNVTITDEVNLTITTNGPNGQTSKTLTFDLESTEPGDPGSVYVDNISETSIGVRATGQKEDTQITFQVVDVNGNPLNNQNAVDVGFKFGNRPNGGEFLSPASARTNNLGQATVTLTSGERAGTVQVVAEISHNDRVIRSQPVGVAINAGLPSRNYFSLLPSQRNMTYSQFGQEYEVSAVVGDKYSNTVPDGVAIFFESNGGSIGGSATTVNGTALTTLRMGNPVPSSGIVRLTARTSNDEQNQINTSTDVIFSGSPRISVSPSSFNLGNAEDQTFTIRVRDSNGHPMVEGTTINIDIEGDGLTIIGNTNFTLRDVNSDMSNIDELTRFIINVRDADPDNVTDDPVIMTIEVEGPNGYARHTIEGRKEKIR
ncbi:MAG: hypothetical protein JJU37_16475 [Balneolaceae bacterium]|nr:hypothetical protein [Balneolaceae bacterium]